MDVELFQMTFWQVVKQSCDFFFGLWPPYLMDYIIRYPIIKLF